MQRRIYLVEDNPVVLEWLTDAIEARGEARVVGSADTEAEACRWLTTHDDGWDVAVVDLWLAEGSGLQVIKSLNRTPEQRIVLLTSYPSAQVRQMCLSAGADAFFDKSTELDEFTQYIAGGGRR